MRILVTGSSGFVGSHLVPRLRAEGHWVIGIDREEPEYLGSEPSEFVRGDLLQVDLDKVMAGVDSIFHLAAAKDDWGISREEYFRENVSVTKRLLDLARRHEVSDQIFYSTVAVHGPGTDAPTEASPYSPVIPYGESKVECEKIYGAFAKEWEKARILIVRPSAIFGKWQPWRTNVHRLIEAIDRRRFVMIGDGSALKTTSYIENLIAATDFLVERMKMGIQTYIYVDEPVMSTKELVQMIYRNLGKSGPTMSFPLSLVKPVARIADVAAVLTGVDFPITAARISKFCTSTNFDSSAIRHLGFEQPVTNEEAVRRTVRWQKGRDDAQKAA